MAKPKASSQNALFAEFDSAPTPPPPPQRIVRPERPKLFYPRTLETPLNAQFALPDMAKRRAVIDRWATALQQGKLATNETKLDGTFLNEVFGEVLGYRNRLSATADWELEFQENVVKFGRSASDGALGRFSTSGERHVVAVIELKGISEDLDASPGGRRSATDQAFDYANKIGRSCKWVIVSNFREIRLFSRDRGSQQCQTFLLESLADDNEFRRFVLLLAAERLLPAEDGTRSKNEELLAESDGDWIKLTATAYAKYKKMRADLYDHLCLRHPNLPKAKLIGHTQTVLDRVLFIAFAQRRGLLPPDLLGKALDDRQKSEFGLPAVWDNLKVLFRWVDTGWPKRDVHAYNGGLFRRNLELDDLEPTDEALGPLRTLNDLDFAEDLTVEALGHIFEQSVSDLEQLHAVAAGEGKVEPENGKRKQDGIFYTPDWVTRYLVQATLQKTLSERWDALAVLKPESPDDHEGWRPVWLAWKQELLAFTVLDPACGSGAFLVAAFDALAQEYDKLNVQLAAVGAEADQVDYRDALLHRNLFGVDLNSESVEITRLSLWLKTAQVGKKLLTLDKTVQVGNSVVSDALVDEKAFDWSLGAPAVQRVSEPPPMPQPPWTTGFDVVIGNPPYVRQERFAAIKGHLKDHFATFDGAADLFVYFFERGLSQCKPGGRLGYIVNNKWLRAGYGEALRGWLADQALAEVLVDFGHSGVFEGADTFPVVAVLRRKGAEGAGDGAERAAAEVKVCQVPKELKPPMDVRQVVARHGFGVPLLRLGKAAWSLERPAVEALMRKIRERGVALKDFLGVEPYRGVTTGCNEAFLIDEPTRDKLTAEDPRSAEIIKPYLRGADIKRWLPVWDRQYMIFARRGIDIDRYPAVLKHLTKFRAMLEPRPEEFDAKASGEWAGRKPGPYKWYEIQDSVAYYNAFDRDSIIHTDICWRPTFSIGTSGQYLLNTAYLWPKADLYAVGVLNSGALWAWMWRNAQHGKDEALRLIQSFVLTIPIAEPTAALRTIVETAVAELLTNTAAQQTHRGDLAAWLQVEHGIGNPGDKLTHANLPDLATFTTEIKKRRDKALGDIKPSQAKALQDAYRQFAEPMRGLISRAAVLEAQVAEQVNAAYQLTDDEVRLMWETAPPRMPGSRPTAA